MMHCTPKKTKKKYKIVILVASTKSVSINRVKLFKHYSEPDTHNADLKTHILYIHFGIQAITLKINSENKPPCRLESFKTLNIAD